MAKLAPSHINNETLYYLGLPEEQRRKLPFAAPYISQDDLYLAELARKRTEALKAQEAVKNQPPAPPQP